jgi:UDPglucose 6-dehydrogenase
MNPDGSASTGIVFDVVREVYGWGNRIVVIKSTVPPGTTASLNQTFGPTLSVVFNPEFLTEANPVEDFKNQDRIIIGGSPEAAQTVADIYSVAYPGVMTVQCDATTAEMVKYVGNCFLATKVSFANEIYQICQKLGIQYEGVVNIAMLDKRLGRSHWKVPGPDEHFGFGLSCFPKDINALIAAATSLGVDPKVLKAVWEKNLEVRPEKDWEQMKGRAVL